MEITGNVPIKESQQRNPMSEAQDLLGIIVEEPPNCFRFMAKTDGIDNLRAHTVEIHPSVTKIMGETKNPEQRVLCEWVKKLKEEG
ncbi:hypothetical protein E2542_SST02263 [Spatholobus suberectus]|nr:hypothetical protein E2542_SST02263 [Spatholobus suberectus]